MSQSFKPNITLFHCINTFNEGMAPQSNSDRDPELKAVRMPCSSMVKDVFLLRAFETGADGVVVLVCPEEQCRYVEGSIRARKRVEWVQNLLDEIGLDGRRLSLFNIPSGDEAAAAEIIRKTVSGLVELGPNPAAG